MLIAVAGTRDRWRQRHGAVRPQLQKGERQSRSEIGQQPINVEAAVEEAERVQLREAREGRFEFVHLVGGKPTTRPEEKHESERLQARSQIGRVQQAEPGSIVDAQTMQR